MSISGGVKFFERSQCLLSDGTTINSTSASGSEDFALDKNPATYLRSVGSNDVTPEVITVTFITTKTISRILLLDHNFKNFTIKYDVAGTWTAFSSVHGLDGSLTGITETAFADDSAYYEFTPVTTGLIQITVNSTQVANAEKYISQIIATSELGTLQGFPIVTGLKHSKNSRDKKVISGKTISLKSDNSFAVGLNFTTYPVTSTYTPDLDLMFTLFDRDTNFLIWLCGGKRGTTYFKYTVRGFRLRDVVEVQTIGDFSPEYVDNIYINTMNLGVSFEEAV